MVKIDHRKLIGFSKGSFVVTMPKPWVEKHNLKKGDTVSIEEGSNELVFYAGEKELKREERSILISTEGKSLDRIKAEIVSAYLNNYNTIEIFSKKLQDDAPVIKGILRNLSGMEIIEQTGHRIVAKDLIDVSSITIQNIIRRMDVITRSMIDDTILCIQGNYDPKNIIHRDADVNRLYYLGFRVIKNAMEDPMLMNKLKTNAWRLSSDRRILSRIEEIADRQKRISRLASEAKFSQDTIKELKELSEAVKQKYLHVMKAYYNNDREIAYEIEITHDDVVERCDNFLKVTTQYLCTSCTKNTGISPKRLKEEKQELENSAMLPGNMVVIISKIADHMKSTLIFIKYISRTMLNMD